MLFQLTCGYVRWSLNNWNQQWTSHKTFKCNRYSLALEWFLFIQRSVDFLLLYPLRLSLLRPGLDSGLHVECLSPFTANAWWFSSWGFLPPSEGLKIVPIGTVSWGQLAWQDLVLGDLKQWLYLYLFILTNEKVTRRSQVRDHKWRSLTSIRGLRSINILWARWKIITIIYSTLPNWSAVSLQDDPGSNWICGKELRKWGMMVWIRRVVKPRGNEWLKLTILNKNTLYFKWAKWPLNSWFGDFKTIPHHDMVESYQSFTF